MLIGLSGKKRVGKDTAGHYLELVHDFSRIAFADDLKKFAKKLGWNNQKDDRGRRFLQDLGMVARQYDSNIWANLAFQRILKIHRQTGQNDFVVTDMRFLNEVNRVKQEGGIVIRITREDEISDDTHASETELDTYTGFDYRVQSVKGDFNALYKQLDDIVRKERVRESSDASARV
ncbi:hypothetical protein LCGC14_1936090 [marine sediment metagenome]|uniref:Deoxynucleoside monophosphate kinase n=1 Tax=marine sediment metagenome TaxID=412755 RepID=A0A0F9FM27_9ZZZZ